MKKYENVVVQLYGFTDQVVGQIWKQVGYKAWGQFNRVENPIWWTQVKEQLAEETHKNE